MALIGTAGWSIPAKYRNRFPKTGTQLEKYAARLQAVEINSSFYRPHQRKTYERWAASVPADFSFAVKVPRSITHERQLQDHDKPLRRFAEEIAGLGDKLGVLLVQLPPKLVYDARPASAFFNALRKVHPLVACEPRHASWFTAKADAALTRLKVARVAADPPRAEGDGAPGGWRGFSYWRLHGSPRIYYSEYPRSTLDRLAPLLGAEDWCIFDNTMHYGATGNALTLAALTSA